ncbi:DUF6798 domain-containing protein [Roseimaritima sediminicola]|uniref:DUF6798 domain-containing protein n=1 Tax=Roseimaritima sediminicola TaxID=2662066 RepID=UPI001F43C29D|nr:DUF6798 domain-containing protein [Roseimaritima sediminicola]
MHTPEPAAQPLAAQPQDACSWRRCGWETWLILLVFIFYAGDPAPAINEAHYLVKAKNFWQPQWCGGDMFVTSGKAHATFYVVFGWLTQLFSLDTTAWIGRLVGWLMLALGLQRLSWAVVGRPYASVIAAFIWLAGIEHGNLAGEWVVGGIEAKVPAYGLVLLGLERMLRDRWSWVWPLFGMAAAFHVLVGGWSVVCGMLVYVLVGRRASPPRRQILPLLVGGAIALLGLLPAVWLEQGTTPADAVAAARIYVYQRIPHHLLPSNFALSWYVRHGVLLALAATVFGLQRLDRRTGMLGWFTVGTVALALVGLVIGLLPPSHPDLAARLLRYYWFRMTDSIVPLALALASVRLWVVPSRLGVPLGRVLLITLALVSILLVGRHGLEKQLAGLPASCDLHSQGNPADVTVAQRQQVCRDWIRTCQWIRDNTDPDAVFLTPRHQQTFKWYAHRAEVVNYKDVPQDVPHLKQWQERFERVFPRYLGRVRVTIQYAELEAFRRDYDADYLVVDRRIVPYALPLKQVYPTPWEPNQHYAVYRLP